MTSENSNFIKALQASVVDVEAFEMHNTPECDGNFSEEYKRKISHLVRNRGKSYYPLIKTTFRRVITIIAATIIAGSITVGAVPELREWFVGLFVTQNEDNADVNYVDGEIPAQSGVAEFILYEPTFIPDGFEKQSDNINEVFHEIYYVFDDKYIAFTQSNIYTTNQIDTENMKTETLKVLGVEAFLSYNSETSIITWQYGDYSYCISGNLCKSDMIHMANSVKVTK